ncbi:MAG: isoamylase early set domain-containing protein [Candidatus Eisenbacteria bacterium]|uniref:Isoamylase early set domain-containing protein n=1 Tax=Eiseniibacteriota bacterium TaxID=2212470 RepID=A0A9D6QJF5_UNCEI|nr:isoamylase early set domain-containing protein [Candidatus Eisenbacteria bacterium]MBI3539121.1 isoamylase early set domain-containing protein [Candidatus Eisenbacteria bacterium]
MNDDRFDRLSEDFRATPSAGPEARARLLERIGRVPPPRRGARFGELRMPAPLAAAAALLLVAAGLLGPRAWRTAWSPPARRSDAVAAASLEAAVVRFELSAPGAARVALVGDFNDWDAAATPMRRVRASDRWTVSLPVATGRHVYAFVVDGTRWVGDPLAPRAPEDGFGSPNSVLVVGGAESTL